MRSSLALILALTLAGYAPAATAADKQQLAAQVFDSVVAPQAEPLVDRVIQSLEQEHKLPAEVLRLYREALLGVFRHWRYRQAYVAAYQKVFSEQELAGILELAKNPAFTAFARESGNVRNMIDPVFELLNEEAKKKLEAQLAEKGLSEWK